MRLFWNGKGKRPTRPSTLRSRLSLEELETRLVPYATTGNLWPSAQLITLSFVPDGTVVSSGSNGTVTSDLFSKFDARFGSASAWENVLIKAAQTWAQNANINFAVVSDNGTTLGQGLYQQGDPGMGDIRFADEPMGSNYLGLGYFPPPANNYSGAGDIAFNDTQTYNINGSSYDLYTVALHEIGHALGLDHSTTYAAVMYPSYHGTLKGLTSDDTAGIQAVYGARTGDSYGGSGVSNPNTSFASAADISGQINPLLGNGQLTNLDISTTSQAEYFKFTAPLVSTDTLTVNVQSTGLSLLRPTVTLYAADQTTVLGTATAAGSYNGGNLTVSYSAPGLLGLGSVAGETFYVKVTGADTTAFGTGRYDLSLNMGTGGLPAVTLPNTQLLNGTVFSGGYGSAEVISSTADFYTIGPDTGSSDSAPAAPAASGTPAHTLNNTASNVSVAALAQPAAVGGVNTAAGATSAASVQGLTQIALVLAPPSNSTQMANIHLAAPANVVIATTVSQVSQAGPQQETPLALSAVETHTVSLAVAPAAVTAFEERMGENESPASEVTLPAAPADVAAQRLAADAVFADPNLTAFGLQHEGDAANQDGIFAGSVLMTEPVSDATPAATSVADEDSQSGALAGLALFGGWWLASSGLTEPRAQTKRPLQK